MNIKCILIDDEPFALNILEDDLLAFPDVEVLAKFSSPIDVPQFLETQAVDLIFSDIQMPELLGTRFIRDLRNAPLVIFTTAYHEYAVEGFELNAVDYLLKPIRKERLATALKKVVDQLLLRKVQRSEEQANYIVVNVEYQKIKLLFEEIIYIEGWKDYVKIHLLNRARPLLTRSNLGGMEKKLPEDRFVRIHNSFIVNSAQIKKIQPGKLLIDTGTLPVGKKYLDKLLAIMSGNS